jgi:hypothetical protein
LSSYKEYFISNSHSSEDEITGFWDFAPCCVIEVDLCFRGACCLIIKAVMEAVYTETLVCFETTWRHIHLKGPEEHHHLHSCETLKSHKSVIIYCNIRKLQKKAYRMLILESCNSELLTEVS